VSHALKDGFGYRSVTGRAQMRKSCSRCLALAGIMVAACSNPAIRADEGYALELAAASALVEQILSRPGPIEAICIELASDAEGDSAVMDLRAIHGAGDVELLAADGCEVVDYVLKRRGGGQAISVTARAPELDSRHRAQVRVFTSTGSRDFVAYRCTLRRGDDSWMLEQCDLEAIT
jgi:hypothetical protein